MNDDLAKPDTVKPESVATGEIVSIKEFLSVFVKIATTLAGFATLFLLFGFTIILSFTNNIKLYGLTNFPQEFYKEAALKFLADLIETCGRHVYCALGLILFICALSFFSYKYRERVVTTAQHPFSAFFSLVFLVIVFFTTLRLDSLPDTFLSIGEFGKVFIFMVSVPLVCAIFIYLGLKFTEFAKRPFRSYYFTALGFLAMFVAIPVSYGDHIFDMDIFPVLDFDYADSAKVGALSSLKSDISNQGESTLFFLLGHCTDKEILFDVKTETPPAKIILVDKSLIKFVRISRNNITTLRSIMKERKVSVPVPVAGVEVKPLPPEIQKLIETETVK